jgi:hypothetical protein
VIFPILRTDLCLRDKYYFMIVEMAIGKRIALVVANVENEDDVHVYLGQLQIQNGSSCFINVEKGWLLDLNEEQLSRLKPVAEELKITLLNADFYLPMTIRPFPEEGHEEYVRTNLK